MAIPRPTLGQYFKVTFIARQNGQAGEMTCWFHIDAVGGLGVTTPDIASAFLGLFQVQFPTMFTVHTVLDAVVVEVYVTASRTVYLSAVASDNVTIGAVAADVTPTQVAAIVKKKTGFAGRAGQGRVYIPFLPSTFVTALGELDPAQALVYAAQILGMCQAGTVAVGGNTIDYSPQLVHSGPRLTAISSYEITEFVASPKLGTQRRRGDYGKLNPVV